MSTPFCIYARRERPVSANEVESMLAAICQQGPDGRGVWCNGPVGLGHLALAETPEMRFESQPAPLDLRIDPARPPDIVISADVRLDNRAEVAGKLQIAAELLPTLGDSQLILAAYLRWGESCPHYLLGDFAFVIWDGPQHKLFCARDPLGVKPLYTYILPDLFLAASDVRGLAAHPQGPHQPNLQAVAYYLREAVFIHPTMTYLEGVTALTPAHTLTVTADQAILRRYWFPDEAPMVRVSSLDAVAEELRLLLDDAVRVRLRRVQNVGAHMSGGLDSTTVAYLAARQAQAAGDSISTYSWHPTPTDEAVLATSEYATLYAAIRQGNFDHTFDHTTVNVSIDDVVKELSRDICLHHSQNFVYEPLVRQAALTRQVRVLLSGWGGDEFISGHGGGYLADLFWRGQWRKIAQNVNGRPVPKDKNPVRHRLGILFHHIVREALPDLQLNAFFSASDKDGQKLPGYLVCTAPDFAAQMAHLPPLSHPHRQRGMRAKKLAHLQYGHLHRRMEAWAAQGADDHIVYRYPLLDRRVVEYALGLPGDAFVQGNFGRYLLRHAMREILPPEVCWGSGKVEPIRVNQWVQMTKAALLPALEATIARLAGPARLEIAALRRTLVMDAMDTIGAQLNSDDVGTMARAIQVLGAGQQLPK